MEKEKGKWEETVRSKLIDFEVNTNPGDWDAICDRLPAGKTVALRHYRRFGYIAAAAIAFLIIAGGLYYYGFNDKTANTMAVVNDSVSEETVAEPVENPVDKGVENLLKSSAESEDTHLEKKDVLNNTSARTERLKTLSAEKSDLAAVRKITVPDIKEAAKEILREPKRRETETIHYDKPYSKELMADASRETKQRRWGFGMGGGSYSLNPSSSAIPMSTYSSRANDEYILDNNTVTLRGQNMATNSSLNGVNMKEYEKPTDNVKHKIPLSAGLGVSYYLNDRWSLQSGLVYTLLRSEWDYYVGNDEHRIKKQKLHYLGIPLTASYKIAEWNRFRLYASAGGMFEYNVYGNIRNISIVSAADELKTEETEYLRMKEPLWSVNARAGIAYPLWRFFNLYAEGGVSYYFDNKSNIETIRSSKPFNVSLQAGLRLGF
ncbi:MAG: PorT family protein [Tannerella sp.]|jgi:opacity protein-like surface antigen|nr:PorT family protein [Tannerella sp.]